ncbi:hypothetical protein BASA50_003382 [Batrachochytrium salamandrivorans]|uniref:Complex 1 LYR protein domain-containing protein n=1 Tax=Batrachochytrium salamandrivorans TaxID=1357716 RepID=A0ABQ8FLG1_9FUNG|nr:hypothetical protein BASA60_008247 [Batrachochytrium salamandrivorans]KAH6572304.1 hypothetical protein BASA62_003453 [Batrachochytrium salamandrivorans]KAH6596921.1 hypothetical protein BASA61_003302 [Batrachochytrium salamandrivorans]KAH6598875.1 hypothetical protein BASA50_003382 [Batrachochytrium salamandrivorans]KAH9250196.1 hypothetical protein BASA81_012004 [Batrachochytrium salamandrivorans]
MSAAIDIVDRLMVLQLYRRLLYRTTTLKHSHIPYLRTAIRKEFEANRHVTGHENRLVLYKKGLYLEQTSFGGLL